MATRVYDQQISGFTDASGNAALSFPIDPGGYAAVYLSAQCTGNPTWELGKNGSPRFFDQASSVVLGPLVINPNERAEVTLIGATANTSVTGELWGCLADTAITALSALPTPSSRAGIDATVTAAAPGVGSPIILLDRQTGNGSISFNGIPVTYYNLMLLLRESAASVLCDVLITYNGDVGFDYFSEVVQGSGGPGNATATPVGPAVSGRIGEADTGRGGSQTVIIHHYANQTDDAVLTESFGGTWAPGTRTEVDSFQWVKPLVTDQVTSINVHLSAGTAFIIGSLYGLP